MTDVYGVRVEIDPSRSTSELQKLNEQLAQANTRIDELQRQMNSSRSSSSGLASAIGGTIAAVGKLATSMSALALIIMGPARAIKLLSGGLATLLGIFAFLPGKIGAAIAGLATFFNQISIGSRVISNFQAAMLALSASAGILKVIIGVTLIVGFSKLVTSIIQATDSITLLQSRFMAFTGTDQAFRNLVKSSEMLGTSLNSMGAAVQRFMVMRTEMGLTSDEAQKMADIISKIGRVSGTDQQSINIATVQFAQALASGTLQGDELRSILESMPMLIKTIADQLGVGVGQMKRLGAEGKLTVEQVGAALLMSQGSVDKLYGQMPKTLSTVSTQLETQNTLLLAHLGQVTGIYDAWVNIVATVADYVRSIRQLLGDTLAQLTTLEKIEETQRKIALARQASQMNPAAVGFFGVPGADLAENTAQFFRSMLPGATDNYIKYLEDQLTRQQNSLDVERKRKDYKTEEELKEMEPDKAKKLADAVREVSKELKSAFGDLGMYTDFDQTLDKIRTKFDGIRRAIETIPNKGIRQSLNAMLNTAEQGAIDAANFDQANKAIDDFNSKLENTNNLLDIIGEASRKFNVPESLIKAIIMIESGANPKAVSNKGAMGLMQLMPGTARDFNVTRPFDPYQNVMGGTRYLSEMIKRFGLERGISAYNTGQGNVSNYKGEGIPPWTTKYVNDVLRNKAIIEKNQDAFRASNENFLKALQLKNDENLRKEAESLSTSENAWKKYSDEMRKYNQMLEMGAISYSAFSEIAGKARIELENAINPNKEMVDALEQQNAAMQGNDLTIRGEQTAKLRQEQEQFTNQLDKSSLAFEENQRRGFSVIQQKAYTEQLMAVGVQIKEVARAQEQFNIENELAQELVAQNAVSEQEYQRWLVGRKEALTNIAEPNKKMLDDLEAELAIYRQFAGIDNGEKQIQQSLAMRQAIESLNKTSPTYDQDVERIKSMTAELEAFKEQLSVTNNQVELFKEAATGIYEAWTGTFESIFEKGIEGFRDMKDEIINLFKKMLAQMIATATARPVVVPIIQTMGKMFGMEGTAGELVKQFGGPLAAGAGGNWSAFSGEGTLLASAQATVNNPAGGMGFVPAGARAAAGVPGWSYGLAGIGGYMAGNMIGGGSPMASMLGAGGAMAGAFFGPQMLAAIGTAMAPGIGTLLGAVVGGLAGSLLGGIFGGEGDKQPVPRARFRQGITSPYQGVGTVTPFGAVGFSDIRVQHGMDQDLVNQGREFVATIRQFEESIAEVMDKEDIDKVKTALEGFTSDSTDFAGILRRRVQVIADAMDLSYRTLLGDTSQMDVGAIAERLGVLKELENALSKTMDDIFEAATIQSGGYDIKVADTLSRLKDEFDKWTGSTPQLEKITSLVEERYQIELDRLREIKSVSENIQSGTEKLLQNLERAGQNQDELLAGWRTQMAEAMASIGTLADPAEIQEAVADYQEAAQAAFGILSDLFRQFESARETIEAAGTSRATAIRRGTMPATDLSAVLQTEFAQRQGALQAATSPEELTKAFNDLQTTLNDWFAIEQSIIDKSGEQVIAMEDLKLAIEEASKSISQSAAEQAKSIRYSVLKPDALISALQSDFATQQSALLSATTPEAITEAYTTIQNTLQQWLNAEQEAIRAADAELQTAEELQRTIDDLRKGLREFIDGLKTSELSPLKPSEKLAEAQQQYFSTLDKARAGDTEALNKLSGSAQEYLTQARDFYASSPDYRSIFDSVVSTLDVLQQQLSVDSPASGIETQMQTLAETFAQKFEVVAQMALDRLASIQINQTQNETAALAETFAQRFEAAAQMALERLATLQAEQLGGVGNLAELADQFQSGIAEMTRIAREQLQQLQDNALARYQEFTAALDETLRNGAGVLSDSLRTAFDAGAALIEEAVAGRYAATQPTATIIPFPLAAAMPASAMTTADQDELEEQLDAIVNALGKLGVIVQVSTREQTRELIKSQPIVREQPMKISTKQVL